GKPGGLLYGVFDGGGGGLAPGDFSGVALCVYEPGADPVGSNAGKNAGAAVCSGGYREAPVETGGAAGSGGGGGAGAALGDAGARFGSDAGSQRAALLSRPRRSRAGADGDARGDGGVAVGCGPR